jgi:hypothetical protein
MSDDSERPAPQDPTQRAAPDEGTPPPEPSEPVRRDLSPFEVPELDTFYGSDDYPRRAPGRDHE